MLGNLTVASSTLDHNMGFFGAGGAIENLNVLTVTNSTFTITPPAMAAQSTRTTAP